MKLYLKSFFNLMFMQNISIFIICLILSFAACGSSGGGGGSADPSKETGAAVGSPTLVSKTDTSITINAATFTGENPGGQTIEYGINGSDSVPTLGWQDGLDFTSLNPNTAYYIFARSKSNETHNAGTASEALQVTTDPADPGKGTGVAVSSPTLSVKTHDSITINAAAFTGVNPGGQTIEYAISESNSVPSSGWQDSLTFSGLNPSTTYYIFARSKANSTHNAGAASAGLSVTLSGVTYAITMQDNGNGTAVASSSQAEAEDTITIDVTPDTGFEFDKWEVVSGGVTLSDVYVTPATFTMPGNDVTIRAIFVASGSVLNVDEELTAAGTYTLRADGRFVRQDMEPGNPAINVNEMRISEIILVGGGGGGGGGAYGYYTGTTYISGGGGGGSGRETNQKNIVIKPNGICTVIVGGGGGGGGKGTSAGAKGAAGTPDGSEGGQATSASSGNAGGGGGGGGGCSTFTVGSETYTANGGGGGAGGAFTYTSAGTMYTATGGKGGSGGGGTNGGSNSGYGGSGKSSGGSSGTVQGGVGGSYGTGSTDTNKGANGSGLTPGNGGRGPGGGGGGGSGDNVHSSGSDAGAGGKGGNGYFKIIAKILK